MSLIDDKEAYVSTTGGNVTFEYGSVVADLAARLGIDPATISQIQGVVHEYSVDLKQRLTAVKAQIESAQATLTQVQAGELTPTQRQNLQALNQSAVELQTVIADLDKKVKGVEGKVPAQLKDRLAKVRGRLSKADARLSALKQRTAAVLKDPSAGERPAARCVAHLSPHAGHHAARAPGRADPR